MLTEKEKDIIACLVLAWDENGTPLIRGASYPDVVDLMLKLGLQFPDCLSLSYFVDKMDDKDLEKLFKPVTSWD